MGIFRPSLLNTILFSSISIFLFTSLAAANDDLKGIIAVQQSMMDSLRDEINTLKLKLKSVEAIANDALNRANGAQGTANDAITRATNDAASRANNAQGTANEALKLANLAKTAAENANQRAQTAQNTANEGVQKAGQAHNAAISTHNKLRNELYARFSTLNGLRYENGRFVLPTPGGLIHIGAGGVCYYTGGRQAWCSKS